MPEMLIGGEWRAAVAEEQLEVVNPATEETVDLVPAGTPEDVDLAVATAKRAFADWSRTDVENRAAILAKAADLIREHAKELAATLTSEQGKPLAEAVGEVNHLAHGVHFYAEAASKVRGAYQDLPSTLGPAYGMVIRRPIGVCAAITPYNFPLTLLGTKVAPALAAGNTVVAKPAATTPLATLQEAGVPDGVLNVVTGRGAEIGDALVGHPDVRRVAFTGSTSVGRHVAALAAPDLKRLSLELGGSDPVIVCADADTVKAEKPKLRMGPIHTRAGRDELLEQIESGVSSGGELLIGGGTGASDRGWFLEPAVIAEPAGASRLVSEEVFGPVLPVFRRANDTRYGLGSSIWTHDARLIHRAAQEIEAGMTWVNQIHYGYDELPFGGVKASGFGKEHGVEALDSYVEIKSVVVGGLS